MIKVFGLIKSENYNHYVPEEDETCDQHCFDSDYCILTVNNTSECLELSHVTLPDNNCPTFNEINYTLTLPSGEVLSWNQTESGWEWKQCREGWKKFERTDGITVCMQTFRVDEKITRGASIMKCEEIGAKLTGVASVDESKWIHGELMKSEGLYDWYSFWIDGKRQCDSDGSCKFVWSDGYTEGNDALGTSTNFEESKNGQDCLVVAYMELVPSKTIDDGSCADTKYLNGYVCGYKLM
ncbi:hypothetical protein B9Z55_015657 [Caenorhabditis nigoni]|uniref:C-type lectin domain-containing protein n=1 Tax=Caenorhabditis nigoni TaxID=1611254 RepID=A0A2G5UBT2_9PELO|nr:hypothetical protein B9Z55_015657 [Caenorhabditis nigoni]